MKPKTLDELIQYMNDNATVFGWKSRCEALTEFAERLEGENGKLKNLVEQMRDALNDMHISHSGWCAFPLKLEKCTCGIAKFLAAFEVAKDGK
jgi:hypothetical protein